jgi:hypothetical protein
MTILILKLPGGYVNSESSADIPLAFAGEAYYICFPIIRSKLPQYCKGRFYDN